MGRRGLDAVVDGLDAETTGRRLARFLPPVLLVAAVTAQGLTPRTFVFAALFAAVPLVAAPLYSAWATALLGLLASASLSVLMYARDGFDLFEGTLRAATVTTVSVIAVVLNRVLRRSQRQLASVRDIAEAAQRALLPPPERRLGPLRIAARYQAAHTDASIGGDLYAVQDSAFGVRMLVGDVRGKGLEAVGAVAIVLGAFREAAEDEETLAGVAERLDRALRREAARRAGTLDASEGFTTAALAQVSGDGRLHVVNCGHPPPLLLAPDGEVGVLDASTPALPLGLAALPVGLQEPPGTDAFRLPPGSTLLMHTDGLTEARDPHGVFYDLTHRLGEEDWARAGPDALLDALLADVAEHTHGGPTDDMALLAVTYSDRDGE
ncbi:MULTISPECIES: PP2C family protein-serine/threonine phosphatase [Streptomyces]|uniref:PP2C family protein-serine/threonine phosphatase n=1 Tax=Streptomyces TaxID=1883 RepID=UPI0022489631|nr:PP2C family protein-serine/threonine phosphatase [Streptomyces sp. JHD 1]MCX2970608.1 PP2C family protein-serine/threonine phosphatase [Streptomyces sp. JHD 1]